MTYQIWHSYLHPIRSYFSSTPFLPLVHSIDTLIIAATTYGSTRKISMDICAFQKFLNVDNHYQLATTRLFCSTIWTTVIILGNAKRTMSFPWFASGTLEGSCMLFIDVIAGLFMALQIIMRFMSVDHRSPAAQQELSKALERFYDVSIELKRDFRRSPSRLAILMHCILVLQLLVVLLLPKLDSRSKAFPSVENPWAIGRDLVTICLAFGLCTLGAMVALVTAEVYQIAEGAFDARIHSGMYATCMYGYLLSNFLTGRFSWFMWIASDALLWTVGAWWEYSRRKTILSKLAKSIKAMRIEREEGENRPRVVEMVRMKNRNEVGVIKSVEFEDP